MADIDQWIEENGLSSLKDIFIDNGFEDLEVIAEINDSDLKEMGLKLGQRKKVLLKVSQLKARLYKKMKYDEDEMPSTSQEHQDAAESEADATGIDEPSRTARPPSMKLTSNSDSEADSQSESDAKVQPKENNSSVSPFSKWVKHTNKSIPMYQNAALRKVKLFSRNEINNAKGLEQLRRSFWNVKAEELCSQKSLSSWKATPISGIIDTAWTLKKTPILVSQAKRLEEELSGQNVSEKLGKGSQKKRTVDENVARTLTHHRDLLSVNRRLEALNDPNNTTSNKKEKRNRKEEEARSIMSSLKLAQESLRKAIANKEKDYECSPSYSGLADTVNASEVSKEDIDGMLTAVLARTRGGEANVDEDDDTNNE